MIETHGGIQHVELAPQLWCVVFFPLAAAIAISYFGLTLGSASEKEKTDTDETITRIAAAGPFAALVTSLYYAFALSQLAPGSRFFLLHFANLLRIGQLDANVDFALDPLAASFAIVISALGGAVTLLLSSRKKDGAKKFGSWRSYARLNACVAAALFFVLADNFPLALLGWGATGALLSSLAVSKTDRGARARRTSFVAARLGDAAFLVAAASLFWSFGGTFSEGDYIPDLDARYAAVSNVPAPASTGHVSPTAKGSVTLASTPGALLFIDESRSPLENSGAPVRAPIVRQSTDAGMHTFRVHPGAGLDDSIVAHVRFADGAEVALILVGATSNFREMRDQLELTDDHGSSWRKDALISRRALGSLGAITFACILLLIAAAIRGGAAPFEAWLAGSTEASAIPTAVLVQGIAVSTSIYLLARVSFLFELSPVASTLVASVGAVTALVAAAAACASTSASRFVGHLAAANFGYALLAFGVGSPIDAVVIAVVASFAIGALALAFARPASSSTESSSRLVIAALAIAPIPGAGVSFAVIRALGAALVSDRLVGIPGALLVAVGAGAAALLGFACWRWLQITTKVERKKAEKSSKKAAAVVSVDPLERNVVLALVGVAVFAGLVFDLGILSGHPFTADASWFASWLTPSLAAATGRESSAVDGLVFALGFGGALAGFAHARNRGTKSGALEKIDPRLEGWETSRAASGGQVVRIASSLLERASLLARDTDRFVIDGVIGAASGIIRLASRLTGGRGQS